MRGISLVYKEIGFWVVLWKSNIILKEGEKGLVVSNRDPDKKCKLSEAILDLRQYFIPTGLCLN